MSRAGASGLRALLPVLAPLVGAGLVLYAFDAVGSTFFAGWYLDLGSFKVPARFEAYFFLFYALFAATAAGLLALGLVRAAALPEAARLFERWRRPGRDGRFIAVASLVGFLLPAAVRALALQGGPLTDDEGAYRFMAQLLAGGHLRAASPPLKLFFDRAFMINDGHYYPQYFAGWPSLMLPFLLVGADGYANAVWQALTVPAVFLVARRLTGPGWARVAVVLFLSSPILGLGAATQMSHTTCVLALAWATWLWLRARDEGAPLWVHAGFAGCLGLSFFIRPTPAIGIGLPLFATWATGVLRARGGVRARRLVAFLLPTLLFASLFLGLNQAQNGSPFKTGYQRAMEYDRENGFRFSTWITQTGDADVGHLNADRSLAEHAGMTGVGLLRLNFALWGWPFAFLFAAFAGRSEHARLLWACFACFVVVHLPLRDPGIDTFGPHHYVETAWPLLLLSVMGLARATRALGALGGSSTRAPAPFGDDAGDAPAGPTGRGAGGDEGNAGPSSRLPGGERGDSAAAGRASGAVEPEPRAVLAAWPSALLAALILVNVGRYLPIRLAALASIGEMVTAPERLIRKHDLRDALVFAPRPYVEQGGPCRASHHHVLWWPLNDPELRNPVLFANHITLSADRRLMASFPGRRGWVLDWTDCRPRLRALESLRPGDVADGWIGGTGVGP